MAAFSLHACPAVSVAAHYLTHRNTLTTLGQYDFRQESTRLAHSVKSHVGIVVVLITIFVCFDQSEVAEAGPFREFFRALRGAVPHPEYRSRAHRSRHKEHNESPPAEAATDKA